MPKETYFMSSLWFLIRVATLKNTSECVCIGYVNNCNFLLSV